ncbi:MAG TPA: hypothetical protein VF021_05730 [Longimicrobiales bacterium]
MAQKARRTTTAPAPVVDRASLRFSAINGILLAAGFAAIAIGYSMLAKGSNVAAPLLIVLGYAVLIPLGIIL